MLSKIDNNKYQVFVMECPASFPFSFSKHLWFVVNQQGVLSRWEIRFYKNWRKKNLGHLHINAQAPFDGIAVIFPFSFFHWRGKVLRIIEDAKNICEFIENSKTTYPYLHRYNLTGPNSNTYVAWVLKNFPEVNLELPWNAIGKNFK